jgi:hypothetical protein
MKQQTIEIVRERERERELTFKPRARENLVFFAVPKLHIKYRICEDELYQKSIVHLKFFLYIEIKE